MGNFKIFGLKWGDVIATYATYVMMTYLTDVWGLGLTHAAGIVNIWNGISCALVPVCLFLADALGHYAVLVISSISYTFGLGFLFMSTPPVLSQVTGTCSEYQPECVGKTQEALFYTSLVLLAIGIAGHESSLDPFREEQSTEDDEPHYAFLVLRILSPIIWIIVSSVVKPWSIQFGVPAILTLIFSLVFLSGSSSYDKKSPQGSPLTTVFKVIVASASKIFHQYPRDLQRLYKGNDYDAEPTDKLRCLDRAALLLPNQEVQEEEGNSWRLCTVKEVEETKVAISIIPMWITFIMSGLVSSIGNTYFQEQSNNMNGKVGNLDYPVQTFLLLHEWSKIYLRNKVVPNKVQRQEQVREHSERLALITSVMCCIIAALVEKRRLNVIRNYDLLDKPDETIPMSVLWLLPQFSFLSWVDLYFEVGVARFFEKHAPASMHSYSQAFATGISGLGFICSVLSVYVVGKISEWGGKQNWFQETLNRSRLDNYYWTLAALSFAALVFYVLMGGGEKFDEEEHRLEVDDS